ncbi:hypothetical protein AAFF_G00049970 [Aldrovandia affinis]|uniref:Uncharacterized protein n=1 Tax=Aldrovandia affinis TaxID=143900 RepID=A0AAD7S1S7_9TELE|nr:hypothetical protein AAFF_G00049970 [Aldrovandia affinis]
MFATEAAGVAAQELCVTRDTNLQPHKPSVPTATPHSLPSSTAALLKKQRRSAGQVHIHLTSPSFCTASNTFSPLLWPNRVLKGPFTERGNYQEQRQQEGKVEIAGLRRAAREDGLRRVEACLGLTAMAA